MTYSLTRHVFTTDLIVSPTSHLQRRHNRATCVKIAINILSKISLIPKEGREDQGGEKKQTRHTLAQLTNETDLNHHSSIQSLTNCAERKINLIIQCCIAEHAFSFRERFVPVAASWIPSFLIFANYNKKD